MVSKINLLDDDAVLQKIKKLVEKSDKVYVLSEAQLEKLEISRKQIAEGKFFTQDEMDKKVEAWLREK